MRPSPLLPALLLACLCCLPTPAQARCALAAEAAADLARWKASGFVVADRAQRNQRALALADCLGDADPQLRDGIAFEALSHWMRGKQLDGDGLRALQANLFRQLDGDDADGYRKPFAALVLSEVARTDRVEAWMTAEERARMAAAAADGLRTSGILPTLKHFPGHGDTAEDSHTALAVTYKTLDELQACELLPFAADTGLHAVMVGHIAAPNVTGDDTPATLSPQLVALIPDAENTLIVTDSLAMDAITAAYTPGEAAVQALQAGCDVLLMPNSLPEAYAAVLEAVQNGTISEERLDRSVNKILLYKQQFAS